MSVILKYLFFNVFYNIDYYFKLIIIEVYISAGGKVNTLYFDYIKIHLSNIILK